MQTRRTPTRHDVFELMQRIAENLKIKKRYQLLQLFATGMTRYWDQIGNILNIARY